jgi:hypothetical protein
MLCALALFVTLSVACLCFVDAWVSLGLAFAREELCLPYESLDPNGTTPDDTMMSTLYDNYVACCNPSIYGQT